MNKPVLNVVDGLKTFWCPGCDGAHSINTGVGPGPRWSWNGDVEQPTFSPSILVQWPQLSQEARARNQAFYAEHGRYMTPVELPYDVAKTCHSFVEAGSIRFLNDCTHHLAGQTVALPAWDDA